MLDFMTLLQHHENSMYSGPRKQSQGRYSTRVRLGNEELSFVEEFCYQGNVMTADRRVDKDIKKNQEQNAVGNMLVRKFSFTPIEAKILLFKSYCYSIYRCAHWRHSFQSSSRKLTVSYSDTCKRLINAPQIHQLESRICDERN